MCTISWLSFEDSYHVFFNRDEQKTRATAHLPELFNVSGIKAIMPIDPQGEGTWLAVNEEGVCFALLNYYQGRLPKGKLKSRGQLIKSLAQFRCFSQVKNFLEQENLNKYPPFSILCFFPSNADDADFTSRELGLEFSSKSLGSNQPVVMIRWGGKVLEFKAQDSPLISSSVKFDDVLSNRLNHFECKFDEQSDSQSENPFQSEETKIAKAIELHASHDPTASELSICMHRDDAHTVSFSHIHVPLPLQSLDAERLIEGPKDIGSEIFSEILGVSRQKKRQENLQDKNINRGEITFAYCDGSPCQGIEPQLTKLELL